MCKYHTSLLGGGIVTQRRNEWPRVKVLALGTQVIHPDVGSIERGKGVGEG